jgi:hypothetical protein
MRAYEFLIEATLQQVSDTSWVAYLKNMLTVPGISIGNTGEEFQGLILTPESKNIIRGFIDEIGSKIPTKELQQRIRNTVLNFTDGSKHPIRKIFKSPDLKGITANKTEIRSKGLVSEALLGAAMFAKLTSRGGDTTEQITSSDVWEVVDRIKPSGQDVLSVTVNDIDNKNSDVIKLEIALANDIQHLLTSNEFRPIFQESVDSWVKYANSSLAQKYSDMLFKNNRPDNIVIRMAGKEGGKVDVLINVLDNTGKSTRKLEQLKLSVKLANSLIGQAPRGKTSDEVFNNLQNFFNPLGVKISGLQKEITDAALSSGVQQHFIDAMIIAYKEAVNQLKNNSDNLSADAKLAEKVSKFIDWHATHNDPNIQVIEKLPGDDFRLLNYKGLKSIFKKENIDVDVSYIPGSSEKLPGKEIPKIVIYDKNNNSKSGKILEIRFRGRGNYFNHIVEPGPLMKELAAYSRFK